MEQLALNLEEAFKTTDIIESICNWNAARYAQTYNPYLARDLLAEECIEVLEAVRNQDFTEFLDGLADVFYVAIGALWKTGKSPAEIKQYLDEVEETSTTEDRLVYFLNFTAEPSKPTEQDLAFLALSALQQLEEVLVKEEFALGVIRAVCDSNDTKQVEKVSSDKKANLNKGEQYVPPTKKIKQIIAVFIQFIRAAEIHSEGGNNGKLQ